MYITNLLLQLQPNSDCTLPTVAVCSFQVRHPGCVVQNYKYFIWYTSSRR